MDKPINSPATAPHIDTEVALPPPASILKWLEPSALDKVMPRTLMARVSLTIVVPLILVQLISTYVFYDNHWSATSQRMVANLAGDAALVHAYLQDFHSPEQRAWLAQSAKRTMGLGVSVADGATLTSDRKLIDERSDPKDRFEQALWDALQRPFTIDRILFRTDRLVAIQIQMQEGVLQILVPRGRIFGSNSTYVFVIWMVGSSMLLFGLATAYLRGQVRAVRRLAQAAESFGKGREVADFPAEGAFEVRQAARAFNIMRDRIQRQIAQRTDMLTSVSHDLRTPLTRMKLQLAMISGANAKDIAELKEDLGEMERMLEAYLAFARGNGAEEASPTNPKELLESIVGRFRREGASIMLTTNELPPQAMMKPVAFERCLGNLIGNAVRYGKTVAVSASRASGLLNIHIDDDGPGISANKREEAFRAFHRLESSRNPKTGGIGLGLTIARDIGRSLGGEIMLDESPLGGLRASLSIPL
jgi:two-component system, OmpR family, osmolarity sensor histidine kinase EnvZ